MAGHWSSEGERVVLQLMMLPHDDGPRSHHPRIRNHSDGLGGSVGCWSLGIGSVPEGPLGCWTGIGIGWGRLRRWGAPVVHVHVAVLAVAVAGGGERLDDADY